MHTRRQYMALIMCLMLTAVLTACAGDRTTRSTGEVIDDNVIAAKVKSALIADPDIKGMQINVDVSQGVVRLTGVVDTPTNVQKAIIITRNVGGVKEVRNNLVLASAR